MYCYIYKSFALRGGRSCIVYYIVLLKPLWNPSTVRQRLLMCKSKVSFCLLPRNIVNFSGFFYIDFNNQVYWILPMYAFRNLTFQILQYTLYQCRVELCLPKKPRFLYKTHPTYFIWIHIPKLIIKCIYFSKFFICSI